MGFRCVNAISVTTSGQNTAGNATEKNWTAPMPGNVLPGRTRGGHVDGEFFAWFAAA
jgi:hypothetical protein